MGREGGIMAYWRSIAPYWGAVIKAWWALFASLVLGAIGGYALIWRVDLKVPVWAWFLVAVLCLTLAQFQAFHEMRLLKDEAATERDTAIKQRDQALAELDRLRHRPGGQIGINIQNSTDSPAIGNTIRFEGQSQPKSPRKKRRKGL